VICTGLRGVGAGGRRCAVSAWLAFSQALLCAGLSAAGHLQRAAGRPRPAWATLSTGLTNATKLASRTICTSPLAASRIAASSSDASVAPGLGWRSVRACSTPAGSTSCT
jgi:hypothetical protein